MRIKQSNEPKNETYYKDLFWTTLRKASPRTYDRLRWTMDSKELELVFDSATLHEDLRLIRYAKKPGSRPVETSFAKFLRYANQFFDPPYEDITISVITNAFAEELTRMGTGFYAKVVPKNKIIGYYRNTIANSCMNDMPMVNFYVIANNVNLLVIFGDNHEFVGRALLWNTDQGKYLDRVYPSDGGSHISFAQRLAKQEDWFSYNVYENRSAESLVVDVGRNPRIYPYMDSFTNAYIKDDGGLLLSDGTDNPKLSEFRYSYIYLGDSDIAEGTNPELRGDGHWCHTREAYFRYDDFYFDEEKGMYVARSYAYQLDPDDVGSGYDRDGYDEDGYDREGYNEYGYDQYGYNEYGYDHDGYNEEGYNEDGYNEDGYDIDGYNHYGEDEDGYNRDGFDEHGYDRDGFDSDGVHRDAEGEVKDGEETATAAD